MLKRKVLGHRAAQKYMIRSHIRVTVFMNQVLRHLNPVVTSARSFNNVAGIAAVDPRGKDEHESLHCGSQLHMEA